MEPIYFETDPSRYKHFKLVVDGQVATLTLDVQEDAGLRPDYQLKLNSYDLSVDIELADAVERLRFEHPEVQAVVITSGKDRIFSAGANIYMLASSTHNFKVNFCKYTNETRLGMEEASEASGQKYLAALNGITSGGGYELALAADEILLVDDGNAAVALPEAPLLAVLPGTGGLTRLVDKRMVRRDRADVFSTLVEGIKGRARHRVEARRRLGCAQPFRRGRPRSEPKRLAKTSTRNAAGPGIELKPLDAKRTDKALEYRHVTVTIDETAVAPRSWCADPKVEQPQTPEAIRDAGVDYWPLAVARELDDATLPSSIQRGDVRASDYQDPRELRRRARRRRDLEQARRSLAGQRDPFEDAPRVQADRSDGAEHFRAHRARLVFRGKPPRARARRGPQLHARRSRPPGSHRGRTAQQRIAFPKPTGSRGSRRVSRRPRSARQSALGTKASTISLGPVRRSSSGLVTFAPDDLDWDDEVRIAIEERCGFSPDAMTGMEASLRFAGPETLESKIFGRLTAWQNWIFQRPNAVGEKGALTLYGKQSMPEFDWRRT